MSSHPGLRRRLRHAALGMLAVLLLLLGASALAAPGWLPLPWPLTPLHSRCIGALQLGLALALLPAWRGAGDEALALAPLRALAAGAGTQALVLAIASVNGAIPPAGAPWLAGTLAVAALATALGRAGPGLQAPAERPDRPWLAVAGLAAAIALAFVVAPGWLAARWPWPLETAQAIAYAGPFAAQAALATAVARERRRYVRRALLPALLAAAAGVLVASVWHHAAFAEAMAARRLAPCVWFGGLLAVTAVAMRQLRALRDRRY